MIKQMEGNLFFSPAKIRCHQVNCKGVMGAGIAVEAKKWYPDMFKEYQARCQNFGADNMGDVQFYVSENGTVLANLFAQVEYGRGKLQTNYNAFEECVQIVYEFALRYNLSVGFPYKIGCDLAGGDWNVVRKIIEAYFGTEGAPTCYIVKYDGSGIYPALANTVHDPTAVPSDPKTTEQKPAQKNRVVTIYTDGACSGNPGPGGWGAILITGKYKKELSGGEKNTTNNRMELLGPINALRALKVPCSVELYTDSQYVCKAFNDHWIDSWLKNGWRNSKKEPVKNKELWLELIALTEAHHVTWHWVKGHADNPFNNRCDELAVAARQNLK